MGGQACVLYGAAEFSRDFDLLLLLEDKNLTRFQDLLAEAQAEVIAVPPFDPVWLKKGHAIHFRAKAPGIENIRIDVMSVLRGVEPFDVLWQRRTTAELLPDLSVNLLSLPDLVLAKKTQRDKDWPMIRRLVDIDYLASRGDPAPDKKRIHFWLQELRTPQLLIECVARWAELLDEVDSRRELLKAASKSSVEEVEDALYQEERRIREEDRAYWAPLMKELEELRRVARRS